jgi:AGZA family xanthine/uracil permease-like MFS transporter
MSSFLEKQFRLKEAGTDVRTEVLAGVTTFMTMAYIIFVNPSILQNAGMPFGALMTATCVSSALATFLMAFMANYPIALAPGMGLNAFFAFGVVLGMGISWQVALAAVFIEGILFVLLTLTKIRETVVNDFPQSLKIGISTGIGLFIAFIGLQNAGIIVNDDAVLVGVASLRNVKIVLAIVGFVIMASLEAKKVKGAILWGILIVTGLSVALGVTEMPDGIVSMPPSVMPIFGKMDFSAIANPNFWIVLFSFFFVDFFDTVGTLVGVTNRAGMLDSQGRLPKAKEALMADAIGTVAGAVLGTSTVTSYVESASGVEQGGRTGLTAFVTGTLLLLALFFSPIVAIVPACATAPALVLVGIFMISSLKNLDFSDWTDAAPACVAFFTMPFAYSIAHGIEFGIVTYTVLKVVTGKSRDVSPIMYALTVLFVAKEIFF